jgi:acyl-CoA synthetase (AMP-forming)/AMP-acid ligase II
MEFSLAEVHEAVANAIPEREALIFRDRRLSYGDLRDRSRQLANYLLSRGLKVSAERSKLAGHKSGQDHLAIYCYNGNEYVEAMLGAFKARVAPLNVNYRYVEEELLYLLKDSKSRAVVYHAEFAPMLERVRSELPNLEVLIQVEDESRHPLLPGAVEYEAALASMSSDVPDVTWSPDDLYILYTGGTTGMPKGVLWRSADIFVGAMGGRRLGGELYESIDEIVETAKAGNGQRNLPTPPLMHGASQWVTFGSMAGGSTLVLQSEPRRLDPVDILSIIEREKVTVCLIVGDAFARPILDEMKKGKYDISSLNVMASGGAPLSAGAKREFLEIKPNLLIVDAIGSSETGSQGSNPSSKASGVSTGSFVPGPSTGVVSEDMTRVLHPGDDEVGWFAQLGYVPLGYLGDEEKTARTFPLVEGTRYAIPGDRARYIEGGLIEVLGRDSVTINSGGEKIFAEEVEGALKLHPAVYDAVVCGRPSERWGQEVVAIVRLRDGESASEESLLAECAKHLARYKFPKAFIFLDEIVRSPSGKADYRWAKEQVAKA